MKIDSRYYYVQDVGRENEAMEPKGTRPAAILDEACRNGVE